MNTKVDKALKVLFFLSFIYLVLTCLDRGAKKDLDFKVFHKAAERVVSGDTDLYNFKKDGIFSFKYSPFSAILFTPLSALPKKQMQVIWSIVNTVTTFLSFFISLLLIKHYLPKAKVDYKILFFALIMLSQFYINNSIQGNINAILYFMMISSIYLIIVKEESFLGSLILATAISIKIIPAAMLGVLFFKKKVKPFVMTLSLVALFSAIPYFVWGSEVANQMYYEWLLVLKDKNHFPFYKWTNQSPYVTWLNISGSESFAKFASLAHFVLVAIMLMYSWVKKNDVTLVSSCIFATLLLSPVVWLEYHLVLAFPIFYALFYLFSGSSKKWDYFFWLRFAFAYLFGKFLVGREVAEFLATHGHHYFSLLFLIALVFMIPRDYQLKNI